MATAQTYHCLCTTLILATNYELDAFPVRAVPAQDQAMILPFHSGNKHVILENIIQEGKAIIVRREDGFEKRTLLRCKRCNLIVGYHLDEAHFSSQSPQADRAVYLLPGALVSTEDMKAGKLPKAPKWAKNTAQIQ